MVRIPVLIIAIIASTIYAYPAGKFSQVTQKIAFTIHSVPRVTQGVTQGIITIYSIYSIPGVSEESMAKLREMLTPPPSSTADFEKIANKWRKSLPAKEQEAIRKRADEMSLNLKPKGKN
ncbi:hypothetical protein Aduo_014439 [Ancylostoma duodenale]